MEYTVGTKVFRDWEIVAEIGEGSYGKVYQLRKDNFGIVANGALKVIQIPRSPSDVKDALSQGMDEQSVTSYFKGVVDDFMREVAVMSDMKSHPNVVGCQDYDIISHTGGMGWDILIRMDLLTPLQEYQTKHTMDEAQVRRLGIDLCEALVHCQKRGLIHRDIKPGNIFVDEMGSFRLGDFGVARTADKTMGGMSKQGTENYMAPEVYLGREYGPTVDIYSLGMVLYQLMNANRLPFYPLPPAPIEFSHRFEVLKKRMSGVQMPPPCQASEEFAAIILKACSFESKDRYRTAADFLEALKGKPAVNDFVSRGFAPEQPAAYSIPVSEPAQGFAARMDAPVPPPMNFGAPTGDETMGPAFAPRPKAESQPAAAPTSAFSAPPKAPQESVQQNDSQFRMIVEDAFNVPGRGVVVTGYVCGTVIHTNDPITILRKNGTQRAVAVAGIEHNHQIISCAQPGTAVGILLSGLSVQDVAAGDRLMGNVCNADFGAAQAKANPGAYQQAAPSANADHNNCFRLIIEDAFDVKGRGVVVTGFVTGEAVRLHDKITVVRQNGAQYATSVAGIEHNHQIISCAQPGTAVGILLSGLSVQDVAAGDRLMGNVCNADFGAAQAKANPGAYQQAAPSANVDHNNCFRLIIEDAFDVKGRGVVVTGLVTGEAVRLHDRITVVRKNGTQYATSVAGIEHYRKLIDIAQPGQAVGILLSGRSVQDVGVGDMLVGKVRKPNFGPAQAKADTGAYQQPAPSANTDYHNHYLEKFGVNIVYPDGRHNEVGDLYMTATEMIFVKKSKGARLAFGFIGTAIEKGEEALRFNLSDIVSGGRTKIGLNSNVYRITLRNGDIYKICVNNPSKIACLEQRFGR